MAAGSSNDPRAAREAALDDIRAGETEGKLKVLAVAMQELAKQDARALKARRGVKGADAAYAKEQAAAAAEQQPIDITQFFPQQQVNSANPIPAPAQSFGDLLSMGGSANQIANSAVAPARQAAGTLPSRQPAPPQQGGGSGMSVNVGGQQFTAPETLTTTRSTTTANEFGPGVWAPLTTVETITEPNALRAGDILAAQQRRQATIGTTLFELGKEGVVGPDIVTAAMALDRGDYETWGRILGKNEMLSATVLRKRMDVQDAQINAYRAQAAQSYETTRGQRILNDAYVQQFTAQAEGAGDLSDNDIFGIPAPGAQGMGLPTSLPSTVRGALGGGGGGGGGGGLTYNQVLGKLAVIKPDKDGKLTPEAQSTLLGLQGWGVQNRIAVVALPKRGRVNDLMRSYGIGEEFSHTQMLPMNEVLGTVLEADKGNPEAVKRVVDEWGLFKSDGQGGIDPLDSGPNMALSRGLVRKLQFIVDARGYGGDPQVAPPEIPAAPEGPTPDALDAEADVELERTRIVSLLRNPQLSDVEKGKLRRRLAEIAGPDKGVEAVKKGVAATGEAFRRRREQSAAEAAEARKYLGTLK